MKESEIQTAAWTQLSALSGVVLWRNNVGLADHGERGRVRYGLAPGSADLVGIVTMPEGVGRFFALEFKGSAGRVTAEQAQWHELVRRNGGFAAVVRSVDEARAAVARCRAGRSE